MNDRKQIVLMGQGLRKEGKAVAAGILPGMLLGVTSDAIETVGVHAVEGGACRRHFAVEDMLQGKTIRDAYAIDNVVFYESVMPGQEVNALITAGETIAKEDALESAGDGKLQKLTDGVIIGYAKQAINMSVEGEDGRCIVEVA